MYFGEKGSLKHWVLDLKFGDTAVPRRRAPSPPLGRPRAGAGRAIALLHGRIKETLWKGNTRWAQLIHMVGDT
jgi:hypothetical protein